MCSRLLLKSSQGLVEPSGASNVSDTMPFLYAVMHELRQTSHSLQRCEKHLVWQHLTCCNWERRTTQSEVRAVTASVFAPIERLWLLPTSRRLQESTAETFRNQLAGSSIWCSYLLLPSNIEWHALFNMLGLLHNNLLGLIHNLPGLSTRQTLLTAFYSTTAFILTDDNSFALAAIVDVSPGWWAVGWLGMRGVLAPGLHQHLPPACCLLRLVLLHSNIWMRTLPCYWENPKLYPRKCKTQCIVAMTCLCDWWNHSLWRHSCWLQTDNTEHLYH